MYAISRASSSPYTSGGGGVNFESQVGAAFVTLMLADGVVPVLGIRDIKKIRFQAKDGPCTDDLVIHAGNDDELAERKVMVSVKSRINVIASDSEWIDVVTKAWTDFRNDKIFRRGNHRDSGDAFLLVTRTLPSIDLDHTRVLFEWARHHPVSDEFFAIVEQAQSSSQEKRQKLVVIRDTLQRANDGVNIGDGELHNFMRHFHWLAFDLDLHQGWDRALLHSIMAKTTLANTNVVWGLIVEEVQYAKQTSGTILRDSLSEDIHKHFRHPVASANPYTVVKESPPAVAADLLRGSYARTLGEAMLLGAWRDDEPRDRACIERFTGKTYAEWIDTLQEVAARQDAPIRRRNDHWSMLDDIRRRTPWPNVVTEETTDVFCRVARFVFGEAENGPSPDHGEGAIPANGPWRSISKELREGLCSGMALLANTDWPSVAKDRVRNAIRSAIQSILPRVEVREWSDIDLLLPVLSEAAPDTFLDRVESALTVPSEPFRLLFSRALSPFMGCSWCGLLWALEGLAWHPDHLQRATLALGRLAEVDAGEGNSANRPQNSLAMIYMPWYPQSLAPADRMYSAIKALIQNCKHVAWKVLLEILPQPHQSSWPSHRPDWLRLTIPEESPGISVDEYRIQSERYTEQAVSLAESEPILAADLLDNKYSYFSPKTKSRLNALLSSDAVKVEPVRSRVWRALNHFIDIRIDSKAIPEEQADWDMPELERLAESLTPEEPFDKHQLLFSHNAVIALMHRGMTADEAHIHVAERQQEAIRELIGQYSAERIFEFAMVVESPEVVGHYFGEMANNLTDKTILPHLFEPGLGKASPFLHRYVYSRFKKDGWPWLDGIVQQTEIAEKKAFLLSAVPFSRETMERARYWPMEQEALYWQRMQVRSDEDAQLLSEAIARMLACQCPSVAADLMLGIWYKNKRLETPPDIDQYVRVLLAAASTEDKERRGVSLLREIIKSTTLSTKQREQLEWAYIKDIYWNNGVPLGPGPVALWSKLARDPRYFRDAVCASFRRDDKSERDDVASQTEGDTYDNRFSLLLMNWNIPPGMGNGESWCDEAFLSWIEEAQRLCGDSGRQRIAQHIIGKVLIHCPAESTELWLPTVVGEMLDREDAETLRHGYSSGQLGSLGVHWADFGGKIYTDKADQYRGQARQAEERGWLRLASVQRNTAEYFEDRGDQSREKHARVIGK